MSLERNWTRVVSHLQWLSQSWIFFFILLLKNKNPVLKIPSVSVFVLTKAFLENIQSALFCPITFAGLPLKQNKHPGVIQKGGCDGQQLTLCSSPFFFFFDYIDSKQGKFTFQDPWSEWISNTNPIVVLEWRQWVSKKTIINKISTVYWLHTIYHAWC